MNRFPLANNVRYTSNQIEICRPHNYSASGCHRNEDCELDHLHCHWCGNSGHKALACPTNGANHSLTNKRREKKHLSNNNAKSKKQKNSKTVHDSKTSDSDLIISDDHDLSSNSSYNNPTTTVASTSSPSSTSVSIPTCRICSQTFPSRNRLYKHIKTCGTSSISSSEAERADSSSSFSSSPAGPASSSSVPSVPNSTGLAEEKDGKQAYLYVTGGRFRGRMCLNNP